MRYCTNQTDKQRQVMENLLNDKERKYKHSFRPIFHDILYWIKTGYTSF